MGLTTHQLSPRASRARWLRIEITTIPCEPAQWIGDDKVYARSTCGGDSNSEYAPNRTLAVYYEDGTVGLCVLNPWKRQTKS